MMDSRDREILEGIPKAASWPPRYRMHKYWGRKPSNVLRYLIESTTSPGDTTLDPFSGSGAFSVEAALLGRYAYAVDINPVGNLIARATLLTDVEPEHFLRQARTVVDSVQNDPAVQRLRSASSIVRGSAGVVRAVVWHGDTPASAKVVGAGAQTEIDLDRTASERWKETQLCAQPENFPDHPVFLGWETRKLTRAGYSRFSELFTRRNLDLAARLRSAIDQVDEPCRTLLLVAFTASLAQMTRMIADYRGAAGGPSWKINIYWLPSRWLELDPIHYFENRTLKVARGLEDSRLARAVAGGSARFVTTDFRLAEDLPDVVDLAFADPPYGGEGIQYLELSTLWNVWIDPSYRFDGSREVSCNPFHTSGMEDYEIGLGEVFMGVRKRLRPGSPLIVTFNNKDRMVWEALMSRIADSGFELRGGVALSRSARSLTETVAPNAPNSDYYLLFR